MAVLTASKPTSTSDRRGPAARTATQERAERTRPASVAHRTGEPGSGDRGPGDRPAPEALRWREPAAPRWPVDRVARAVGALSSTREEDRRAPEGTAARPGWAGLWSEAW